MADKTVVLRIFRMLMRSAGEVRRQNGTVPLSQPLNVNCWGQARHGSSSSQKSNVPKSRAASTLIPGRFGELLGDDDIKLFSTLLPWQEWPRTATLTGSECETLIRKMFRHPVTENDAIGETTSREQKENQGGATAECVNDAAAIPPCRIDAAFMGLRIMHSLSSQWRRSSFSEAKGVRMVLDYCFLKRDEVGGNDEYAYRLLVENRSESTTKVLARHWLFKDKKGSVTEIPKWGEGVVGQQPVLQPGGWFEYVSGTTLKASPGAMQGAMLMIDENNETWEAEVPRLELWNEWT